MTADPGTDARAHSLGHYPVRASHDVIIARAAVRRHASVMGFDRVPTAEMVIVASELASNVLRHGNGGWLEVERSDSPTQGIALILTARDFGPPFADFDRAVRDRSTDLGTIPPEAIYGRPGIGRGLGAVQRFCDALGTEPLSDGKRVVAVRYLRAHGPRGRIGR